MRALYVIILLLCAGCSQNNLLTRQDYQKSREAFARGDTEKALLDFPGRRENGDFITTMEKGYLSLLQGKPQIDKLQKQAAWQENQVRFHVSREARTFFYVRTPEDYYPSEHEVIWLHFLLGWGYAQQGKYTDACVEARIASDLLTLPWSPSGHFDDSTMRLFLAGLWSMCGQWREAQVDFRAAWMMDNSLAWAKEVADRDKPPAQLFIVLGGPGPEVVWDPEFKLNPLRSGRRVSFRLQGRKSTLFMADQNGKIIATHLTPDAGKWYARHLVRESELDEIIQDSAYGGKAAASGIYAGGWIVASTGAGVLVAVGGSALSVGLMYAYAQSGGVDARVYLGGLALIPLSILKGIEIAQTGYQESTANLHKDLDPSPSYRFVRYLPEYMWIGWSDQPAAFPVKVSTPYASAIIEQPQVVNGIAVSIAHLPDSRSTSCTYNMNNNSYTLVTEPDANGNCSKNPDW
ncbi:MAG TPA: hypothetical protein VIU46_00020 [Gallionellaceae bacterium]